MDNSLESNTPRLKKKRPKSIKLLDPEQVYSELMTQYHSTLASDSSLHSTPLKHKSHKEEGVETPSEGLPSAQKKRKVSFNLKLNRTQGGTYTDFAQDEVVATSNLEQRMAGLSPGKGLLKTQSSVAKRTNKQHKVRK